MPSKPARKPPFASKRCSEETVHRTVTQHLTLRAKPGIAWFHPANGEARSPATAGRLKAMGVRPGVPDIIIIANGRCYALELKRDQGGRLSPHQKAMHAEFIAAGAIVETACGIDAALEVLERWGVFRENPRSAYAAPRIPATT